MAIEVITAAILLISHLFFTLISNKYQYTYLYKFSLSLIRYLFVLHKSCYKINSRVLFETWINELIY
jgi:hypothetical protein